MALELYNSTRRIKEVPKFRYMGKIKLNPGSTYSIKEHMVNFYKPYERIGVIVRNSAITPEPQIEEEVEKVIEVINAEKELNKMEDDVIATCFKLAGEEPPSEEPETTSTGGDIVTTKAVEFEDNPNEVEQVGKTKEVIIYTKEQLAEMKLKDMKSIIEKLGIPTPNYNRDAYMKAILEAQENMN